uniref:Macaca fascicularis brain cDNA clone: QflA-21714, similar to human dipeptidylpeptidase 9 (DPP9), mRNA, RefSeq: NM_139159.2 n=1 Tax=Macaca fascicularis TaxID=9541 RepID=I7GNN7_MACFA|nr:unnamed protein product [Macaca fascicularis]
MFNIFYKFVCIKIKLEHTLLLCLFFFILYGALNTNFIFQAFCRVEISGR